MQTDTRPVKAGFNGRLETLLEWAESHLWLFATICFVAMLCLSFFGAPFNQVLRDDALGYLLKAFEIIEGDWTPALQHFQGWPIFMAGFLKFSGIQSLFEGMTFARILSMLLQALLVYPLALLTRLVVGGRTALFVLAAFALSRAMISLGPIAYTEPLFLHLVLGALYFLVRDTRTKSLLLAAVLAGFALHVRDHPAVLWTTPERAHQLEVVGTGRVQRFGQVGAPQDVVRVQEQVVVAELLETDQRLLE